MAENILDNFLTSKLAKRYNVSRSVVSERLKALNIKPYRQDNSSYITGDQLMLMDELDAHLKGGGETEEFVQQQTANGNIAMPETDELEEQPLAESSELVTQEPAPVLVQEESQTVTQEFEPVPLGVVAPCIESQELESIDRQAQFIAAGRYIATQELADYYAQTGNFTLPEVVQRIKQRRAQTSAQWEQSHRSADPNALSQLLIQQARRKAAGAVDP